MPLRPEGARLLVIRSSDGTVLYEGGGQVEGGIDLSAFPVPGPDEPQQVWSFEGPAARDGARHWAVQSAEEAEEAGRSWRGMVRSMTERAAQTRAQELASAVRYLLEAYGLAHRVDPDEVPRDVRDAIMDNGAAWLERFWTGTVRAEVALEEFQRAVMEPVPEYDELIESTRVEFPHDPYQYGQYLAVGPMRWTPPEDVQEVPRCP